MHFPETLDRSEDHELGPEAAYRLYQGRNSEQSFNFFRKKMKKVKKINFW